LSVGEWLIQYWKEHKQRYRRAPVHQRPVECTVVPGDVMFVPHGWWHMAVNLDDVNIAITHNYVSRSNLGNVLRFFQEKQDQISGCRDRKESIKPEQLRDEFVKVLGENESSKEEEHEYLQSALAQPDWTCHAWSNAAPASIATTGEKQKENASSTSSSSSNKKRLHTNGEDGTVEQTNESRSVMSKTEKVAAFSFGFSFL
jgi:ribosomal protein L16 Arg81 hydroxylase